jgi:threonine/homoserine/homoserine lactone efflux protein
VAFALSLVAGLVFGLALAAPPGPMNAIIAEESVRRGWGAGFRAGLGAAMADAIFFVLSWLGVARLVADAPTLRGVMLAVGGVLMLYFAYGAVQGLSADVVPSDGTPRTAGKGFRKALVLALTNPYQILFWLTVGVGLLRAGTLDVLAPVPLVGADLAGTMVVTTGSPALFGGFFAGIGVWIVGFPAGLVAARRRVERLEPVVAGGAALVLAGFGLYFLREAMALLA